MTAKHTPGEWKIVEFLSNSKGMYFHKIHDEQSNTIVEVFCHPPISEYEHRSNARLIAAAPALLAACKWTARGEHHRACSHRKNPNTCDCYVGACKSAISAGESGE